MTKKFLHVGCGRLTKANSTPEFQKKEWIETRLDIDESVTPDIISSITDMSVVDSDSFDAVYSSHNIEHLFSHEVPLALKEMHRVLCDDGFLVITCPDLQSVCEHVVNDKLTLVLISSFTFFEKSLMLAISGSTLFTVKLLLLVAVPPFLSPIVIFTV